MAYFNPEVWGTVADWVSGIATAVAVGVALHIANRDNRTRDKEKEEQAVREAQIENLFLVEVLRLYRGILLVTTDTMKQFGSPDGVSIDEWKSELRRARETSLRYQQMPKITMRAYHAMDDIVHLSARAETVDDIDMGDVEQMLASTEYTCEHAMEIIEASPNRKAPFHWD